MFTGLVKLWNRTRVVSTGAGKDLVLAAPSLANELALGESVAINGAV